MPLSRRHPAGFTLLELAIVVAVIGVILAVALPQLLPAIAYGRLEGEARHIGNYGRAAIARATMMHRRLTVRFDVANGEYWTVEWPELDPEAEGEEGSGRGGLFNNSSRSGTALSDRRRLPGSDMGTGSLFDDSTTGLFDRNRASQFFPDSPSVQSMLKGLPDDAGEQAVEMQKRFEKFERMQLMAQARNVEQDGLLSDIGPLFEKKFSLDDNGDEAQEEELQDDVLGRTRLPEGVRIDSVRIGNETRGKGFVEIEITAMGLLEPVTFYLKDDEGEFYTIVWDAITGGAHLVQGKASGA